MQFPSDYARVLELAQSPAGQQLLSLLQRSGGTALQEALAQASGGNYQQAKQTLSSLLSTPEAQALLSQLEAHP